MKQIYMILAACLLSFSCSKNKDSEPAMGYFVKTIKSGQGESEMKFELQYDDRNRLVEEHIKFASDDTRIRYDYDDDGHIIRAWWDDRLYGTFEYEGNILTKIMVPPNDTDPERTFPVTFADGTYQAMDGSIRFRMDDRQQLVYDDATRGHYTYTDKPGIHKHLYIQPAWFMGELSALAFYSLKISRYEIATITMRGTEYEARNKTDGQGNIIRVEMMEKGTGTAQQAWDITYEQRVLK